MATTIPIVAPNLTDLRASNKIVSDAIDEYYQNNPISSWIKNYKQARELDYINQQIAETESKINKLHTATTQPQTIKKAFKNQFASDILNVHRVSSGPDTFYMVFANKGCLQPDEMTKRMKIAMCDANVNAQKFKVATSGIDNNYTGASQLRLKNDPTQCLEFNRSGLSVQPCDTQFLTAGQNFKELYQSVRTS